jgi:flagellar assembly factor FliW
VWGVILIGVNSKKKNLLGLIETVKGIFFSVAKGLSNMVFSHFKRMHLGSISFSFLHLNMLNDFSLSLFI